MVKAIHYQI